MANIVFEHVTGYSDGVTIQDFNLEIRHQDFFVLLGRSESGAKTVLRCLQGLVEVSAGRILIDGQNATDWPPKKRNIKTVGAHFALYSKLNVYDNLAFDLKVLSLPEADIAQQVNEISTKLGLESVLSDYPDQLTKLQRRDLSIGRIMLQKPTAFLFDLDLLLKLTPEMLENLKYWHHISGLTFITSTVDSKNAFMLGTRIAILKDGILQQVDIPENLILHPANDFVSEFIPR